MIFENNKFQSLLIIAELLTTQNIHAEDLDILGRIKSPGDGSLYQRASSVPRTIGLKEKTEQKEAFREESPKFSTNEVNKLLYNLKSYK